MPLSIIVAVADNNAIGRNGDLAFHISADLRRFKQLTMGRPVIMGRKTFESLPKGALPGRRNIVITRNKNWSAPDVEIASSLKEAINISGDDAFIIGGGQIYAAALPLAKALHVTRIFETVADADTFFPDFENEWNLCHAEPIEVDQKTGISYQFRLYQPK